MNELLANTSNLLQNLLLSSNHITSVTPEYFKYIQFIPLFILFFLIAFLLTPIIGRFAKKVDAIDYPANMRKEKLNKYDQTVGVKAIHKTPTPLLGGVAVLLPVLIAIPFFITSKELVIPFLIASGILFLIGFLDDVYNLPAPVQLAGQLIAASVIALSMIDIPFVNNPFGGTVNLNWFETTFRVLTVDWRIILPGDLLVVAWIMICTNAVKWVGGIGGLLESNMLVAFALLFILGVRTESSFVIIIAIMLAGAIAGGWIFDFPPSKIFTGSTGKTLYGFIIAVLAIANGAKVAATIIILALPLVDAIYVIYYRYTQFKPKNIIELMRINGPMHLHHQLNNMNFTAPQILLIETSISLFFGIIAVLTTGAYKFVFLLVIIFVTIVGIIILNQRAKKRKEEGIKQSAGKTPESKYSY
ncbi:undecaprenyl/decaprenyl-phosphate alpha-N-acetylglucosaminyl 1-phosphate transferase [Candidatus Dojkabacteria bacterium]|nr:undecaprenyl/decaprenyl-phosphate alpha-N-acetylglucosaminyl 1-phosphate transferase [Candidatus Dojkabacteria bacterium]